MEKFPLDKPKINSYDIKGFFNIMQNEVKKMKVGVGAMSELLRMFYDSIQAIQLTSDYMKAVFEK